MEPGKYNIKLIEGTLQEHHFQWATKDASNTIAPVDINLTTAKMQIRKGPAATEILDELSTSNSRIVYTDAVNGKFKIIFPPDVVIGYSEAFYDLKIYFIGTPDVRRIVEGTITVSKEITK